MVNDNEIDRSIAVGRIREVRVKMTVIATVLIAKDADVCEIDPSEVVDAQDSYEIEEM